MNKEKQQNLARKFQNMHKREGMFVLPNAWNAGSAFIFCKEGFEAVATTSAGVAYALGYPDGEDISFEDLLLIVLQMTKRLSIPVSVDFERGYSENVNEIKENAKRLIDAGAVGFNIEDGKSDGTLDDIEFMTEKISALCEVKKETDIDFVINARTCAYWLQVGDAKKRLNIAINRGEAFKKAGADCMFIPGLMDKETVKALVSNIELPINIVLNPLYNDFEGLNELGVKRLSVGSAPVRSAYNHIIKIAFDMKSGKTEDMLSHDFSYKNANEYFEE